MGLPRRPALWAVMIAAVFAFTIGGSTLPSPDTAQRDVPVLPSSTEEGAQGGMVARAQFPPLDSLAEPADEPAALAPPGAAAAPVQTVAEGVGTAGTTRTAGSAVSGSAPETAIGSAPDTAIGAAGVTVAAVAPAATASDQVGGPTDEDVAAFDAASRWRVVTHVVKSGETLSSIAARYKIAPETILASNEISNVNLLQVGQALNILSTDGAIHRVQSGESLWDIARMYRVDLNQIAEVNNLADPNRVRASQELIIPGTQAAVIGSDLRTERLVSSDGRLLRAFSWPVQGRISSQYGTRWGRMHHGLDIAVNTGTAVRASASGRVSFAGWNGGYGYLVVVDHGNRVETRYAHLSRIVVNVGQQVRRGDLLAYSGNTGNSTGPHLHFEIRRRGDSVNPVSYLR